jgi:hypothetical protein
MDPTAGGGGGEISRRQYGGAKPGPKPGRCYPYMALWNLGGSGLLVALFGINSGIDTRVKCSDAATRLP